MNTKNLDCPHFGPCAGCVFDKHLDDFPLVRAAKGTYRALGIENIKVHYFGPQGWRTRAKLAVRGTVNNPQIGLFKKGSHDVLPFQIAVCITLE